MSTPGKSSDELVDEFVRYANKSGFEPKFPDALPEELRTSTAEYGMFNWQIRAVTSNAWIENLAQELPQAWPHPFHSLIARYRFCNFEIGPLMFFANTGHHVFYELSRKIFNDKAMFPILHSQGYLQFGLPHETNYDPVCFDMQRRKRGDAPIVQIDHEEILIRSRIRVIQEIAPSFAAFLRRAISERLPVG